ncbi:hypothetical protein ES703_116606 [subsurface metagenome]
MADKKLCLHCKQSISGQALYVLNQIAQRRNYCSWPCLVAALDPETVNKMLQDRRKIKKHGGYSRPRKKAQKISKEIINNSFISSPSFFSFL